MAKEKEKVKKDDYQKALTAYQQSIKPFRKGDFKKALELLQNFLDKYNSEKELCDRAQIYVNICEERLSSVKEKLDTCDDYYQYAVYRFNLGEYEEALKLTEKASELEPKEGRLFYLLANIHLRMENVDASLDNLKNAIQIDEFFKILARNETEFEELWEDEKFKLITKQP